MTLSFVLKVASKYLNILFYLFLFFNLLFNLLLFLLKIYILLLNPKKIPMN